MTLQEALTTSLTNYAMLVLHRDCVLLVHRKERAYLYGKTVAILNPGGSMIEPTGWPKSHRSHDRWVPLRAGKIADTMRQYEEQVSISRREN